MTKEQLNEKLNFRGVMMNDVAKTYVALMEHSDKLSDAIREAVLDAGGEDADLNKAVLEAHCQFQMQACQVIIELAVATSQIDCTSPTVFLARAASLLMNLEMEVMPGVLLRDMLNDLQGGQ